MSLLTDSLPPRPEYFGHDVEMNRQGAGALDQIPPPVPVRAPEVFRLQAEGAIVLDTRPAMQFAVAHVPGSIHIGLSGQYASWAARILGLEKQIILVGEDSDHLRESQMRLARVGIENVHAYLEDGITGWIAGGYELDYIPQVSVQEFSELLGKEKDHIQVLDVRSALDDFACNLVSQHHTGRRAGPAAYHVLIGPADVGGHDLQDDAMRSILAAEWIGLRLGHPQLGVGNRLNFDLPGFDIGNSTIGGHGCISP